jgi:hypothetical protein
MPTRGSQVDHRTCLDLEAYLFLFWIEPRSPSPQKPNFADGNILTVYSFTPRTYATLAHNYEPIKFISHWRAFLFTCTDTGFRFNVKLSFKTENQFKSTESASSTCHLFANTFLFVVSILFLSKAVIDDSHNQRGKFRICDHHCQQ